MIYRRRPEKFNPQHNIVACFVEYDGEILLLYRQDQRPEGNTWGIPAGKVNIGEKTFDAIVREIQEEIGFNVSQTKISYLEKVYMKCPSYDYVCHIFHTELDQQQKVEINHKEHKDFKWISPRKALNLPLIQDLDNYIKLFYKV